MARKELTVTSYIVREGKRTLISSLPKEEQKKLASALTDKFMLAWGYVPENTEDIEKKSKYH